MNPEILYQELNRQVKDGAQELVNVAYTRPDFWWTVDALAERIDGDYSRAALGLAMDRLLLDDIFELKPDMLAGRRMKLRKVYNDNLG